MGLVWKIRATVGNFQGPQEHPATTENANFVLGSLWDGGETSGPPSTPLSTTVLTPETSISDFIAMDNIKSNLIMTDDSKFDSEKRKDDLLIYVNYDDLICTTKLSTDCSAPLN